jgi:drug/metabolite transporter (DMT)-like permease
MTRPRGFALMLASTSMMGVGVGLTKLVTEGLDPIFASFVSRAGAGLFCLGVLALNPPLRLPRLSRSDWRDLLLLAGVCSALPSLLTVEEFHLTSVIKGGVLMQLEGVAAVALTVLFLSERIVPRQIGGMVLLGLGGC